MELSVCEAKTRFAEAADPAARDECVVVTEDVRPFAQMVPAQRALGMDFAKAALVHRALGIDGLNVDSPADFDDLGFGRRMLGLEYCGCCRTRISPFGWLDPSH